MDFFEENCEACRNEYLEMMGVGENPGTLSQGQHKYKELSEGRAKKLYEEIMLQYIKHGMTAVEADARAKSILRKQCAIRGIKPWTWL